MAGIIIDENSHKNFQFFWHEYDAYGVFSQWFEYSFVIEGIRYANAEQYMMAKKALLAGDMKYYEMIMAEKDPAKCKKLGKAVRNLNVKEWNACKQEVVYHANLAKFSQNEKALRYLLSTGDKILAEASPYDTIWGIGLEATHPDAICPEKWRGQNLLGKVLMKVRRELNRNNAWNLSVEERRKSMSLEIRKISITDLAVDAIVNAANSHLQHGGGVCGAIFSAAGPRELQAACDEIGYCETGSAATTPGFRLKARYVIHAVGPVWYGGNNGEGEKLYSCYQAAMEEARNHDCHSIAFPLISSGIYGYPQEDAWRIAIQSVRDWQKNHGDYPLNVVMAVIDDRALKLGNSILSELCP